MIRKALMTGCLALTVVTWAWAQEGAAPAGGGGGAAGGGAGAGGGGNIGGGQGGQPGGPGGQGGQQGGQPGMGQPGQQQDPFGQRQQPNFDQMPRPIFLSGEVRLANGTPPPEAVVIERVCGGQARPEGYTDSKGRFSFQVGADQTAALMDASYNGFGQDNRGGMGGPALGGIGGAGRGMGGGMDGMDLSGCELRASLPGFRSDQLMLGRRRPMDNPNVGTIVLHPLDGFQGTAISATTLTAPNKAKAAYEKGVREMRKDQPKVDKAAEQFQVAVDLHPTYAAAWTMLAEMKIKMDDLEGAEEALGKSIEADPGYIRPYEPLIRIAAQKEDWPRVNELAAATLRMHPGHTQIRYLKAVAAYRLGRFDEAETAAREIAAGSESPQYPHAHQMMGIIYIEKGAYPQAADSFRTYLKMAPTAPSGDQIRKQLAEWEALGVVKPAAADSAAN